MTTTATTPTGAWIDDADCDLDDFRALVATPTDPADYPMASDVRQGVVVYSAATVTGADRRALQAELIHALMNGPGVVAFEDAFSHDVVDAASEAFTAIIDAQRAEGGVAGDHFGKAGANDRIWNAAQKLALHAPEVFADYYAADALALVCEAWLGPRYQVTSQVNVVNPGGGAQVPHRDFHLGFVDPDQLAAYPRHVHAMSPALTLQGAVAHCDMPLESGPTMLLPHSQRFTAGYVAFYRQEFIDYFADHHVQLPLRKGDAVFFNPALMHGAGANTSTDVRRMANLLQISSPFGRAMEAMDRTAMVRAIYPSLLAMKAAGRSDRDVRNAVNATAEGYAFPTNLDRDQPIGSLAPPSQVDTVLAALASRLTPEALDDTLAAQLIRRIP
jgi:ectoine hydroxylase-related dioxygenase (phytanoyl-CoA dioxygenase family)